MGVIRTTSSHVGCQEEPHLDTVGEEATGIDTGGSGLVERIGVLIDDVPGGVGGKVEFAVSISQIESQVGHLVGPYLKPAAHYRVVIVAVEVIDAVGHEAIDRKRIRGSLRASGDVGRKPNGPVRAGAHTGTGPSWSGALSRKYLHDTGGSIRSVQYACRSAQDFNAVDVRHAQVGKVVESAGLVERNTVDEYLDVIRFTTADEHRGEGAERTALHDTESGHRTERIQHIRHSSGAQLLSLQDGDRRGHGIGGNRDARGRHDNIFEARRVGDILRSYRGREK